MFWKSIENKSTSSRMQATHQGHLHLSNSGTASKRAKGNSHHSDSGTLACRKGTLHPLISHDRPRHKFGIPTFKSVEIWKSESLQHSGRHSTSSCSKDLPHSGGHSTSSCSKDQHDSRQQTVHDQLDIGSSSVSITSSTPSIPPSGPSPPGRLTGAERLAAVRQRVLARIRDNE